MELKRSRKPQGSHRFCVFPGKKKAWIEEISITLHFPWGMSLDGQVLGFRESLREMVYRCLLFFFFNQPRDVLEVLNQYEPIFSCASNIFPCRYNPVGSQGSWRRRKRRIPVARLKSMWWRLSSRVSEGGYEARFIE
jgi:hypothetical protein